MSQSKERQMANAWEAGFCIGIINTNAQVFRSRVFNGLKKKCEAVTESLSSSLTLGWLTACANRLLEFWGSYFIHRVRSGKSGCLRAHGKLFRYCCFVWICRESSCFSWWDRNSLGKPTCGSLRIFRVFHLPRKTAYMSHSRWNSPLPGRWLNNPRQMILFQAGCL